MNTKYILFSATIEPQPTARLYKALLQCLREDAPEIYLLFSSQGGSIPIALALANFIQALDVPLTIYNMGNVDSAAIVVYAAAAVRVAAPQAKFFAHPVNKSLSGAYNIAMLEREMSELRQDTNSICEFLQARTGTAAASWNQLMNASTTFSSVRALELGLVTRVELPHVLASGCDCEILSPNVSVGVLEDP
jgi:ATP-dependent protease ClpP protease subunit